MTHEDDRTLAEALAVARSAGRACALATIVGVLVEVPVMLTAPVRGEVPYARLEGELYEYACHEANYAMENVLKGARLLESEALGQ